MKILVIVAYAGSEKLVRMTERMLEELYQIIQVGLTGLGEPVSFHVVAVNNAAVRAQKFPVTWHIRMDENVGFGNAVNKVIQSEIYDPPRTRIIKADGTEKSMDLPTPDFTDVLVLNNDLEFPDTDWLRELLREREGNLVLSPCTDVTATADAVSNGSRNVEPIRHREVSAFCWLVPVKVIAAIRKRFGFNLFHPSFTNYGSDDVTAACLRALYGPKPFKIVPRSWVKHLKARTANELGVKAGTPQLLRAIANYKKARKLT